MDDIILTSMDGTVDVNDVVRTPGRDHIDVNTRVLPSGNIEVTVIKGYGFVDVQ